MQFVNQAHPDMPDRWARFVERFLTSWYDAALERRRDARTEAIRQRSIRERIQAEPIIDEYKAADARRR